MALFDQEISEVLPLSSYYDKYFNQTEKRLKVCPNCCAHVVLTTIEQERGFQEDDWCECPVCGHEIRIFGYDIVSIETAYH